MPVTIAFVRETAAGERRAALTPETAKKLAGLQAQVCIGRGAGEPAGRGVASSASREKPERGVSVAASDRPPPAVERALLLADVVDSTRLGEVYAGLPPYALGRFGETTARTDEVV